MVLPLYPTSRRGIDFRVPRAGCACTPAPPFCRMSPVDKSEPRSLSRTPPAPYAPSGMTRAVSRLVCGSACVNGLWRPHARICQLTRTRVYGRTQRPRRLYTQLDSLMTRRIQESNSDDGPGWWCAATRRGAAPQLHAPRPTTPRGRISMRAVTPIHAANYYRKRRNRTRLGNWPPRLDLYSIYSARKALSGG